MLYKELVCLSILKLLLIFDVIKVVNSENSNILVMSPSLSKSNQVWNHAIALGLQQKGHNVTFVTPCSLHLQMQIPAHENISYIFLEGVEEFVSSKTNAKNINIKPNEFLDTKQMKSIARNNGDKSTQICSYYLTTEGFQQLFAYPDYFKFDVFLWDLEFSECLYPLIPRFRNPPVIILSPSGLQPSVNWIFGTQWQPYIPLPGLPYDKDMNFLRRYLNALTIKYMHYQKYEVSLRDNISNARKVLGNVMSYEQALEIEGNFSLVLANSDFETDYARDLAQNIILVGGLHLDNERIQETNGTEIVNEDETQVIYVSIQESKFDRKQLQEMAYCFGSLDYKVFWKLETLPIIVKPKNVFFNTTFNQIKILSDKNLKLFITSGNLLSLQEALHFSVPILAIPSTYVQRNNVMKLPIVSASTTALNEKYLCQKIREVLNDKDGLKTYITYTRRLKDKPLPPMKKAIFWIEYVIRHGPNGLSPVSRRMSFLEAENLDLLFFAILMTVFLLFLLYKILGRIKLKCTLWPSECYDYDDAVTLNKEKLD